MFSKKSLGQNFLKDQNVINLIVDIGNINEKSEIIEMALSDHISFKHIETQFGIKEKDVKKLMKKNLKESSYKVWRKRVRVFSDRRKNYK